MAGFVVGVTGGVASGKSAVTILFQSFGVAVADADLAARTVVAPGQPALQEIEQQFGNEMLLANGMLNRVRMRERIFEDPQARSRLEAITHPRIREILQSECDLSPGPYVIAAIPLLAETGVSEAYDWLDRRLVIDSSVEMQVSRLMRRDAIAHELAWRMVASQSARNRRLAIATDVIVNDGTQDCLRGPVSRLHKLFLSMAASRGGPARSL